MFQRLVNHNDDIARLVRNGFAVAFDNNYLVIRDIPYLDNQRELKIGAIVTKLVFVDQNKVIQEDHQIYFAGSVPYNLDGNPIPNLAGGPISLVLSEASSDVVIERSFSNKPNNTGFRDFFEKIESYVAIISGPAIDLHGANPYTFRTVEQEGTDSVFKLSDTLTSRAEIGDLSAKFKDDVIAVIGLGGTGAYVLDFLAKTPVREIRTFDLDRFYVHNAFRSPGRLELNELGKLKSEVYNSRYENFRKGLNSEAKFIDKTSTTELEGVTFAFVCVDKGTSRAGIFDLLISLRIPFIDVGMGLNRKNGSLKGMLRTTYYSAADGQNVVEKGLAELEDTPEDMYRTNVQIGELNALNACLAIIRFKQLRGFYTEEIPYYHLLFDISDMKIVGASSDED
ncbi:ThiF family adenylyltransferase [Paenibacillus alginolyticus]|uniref:ThiF family adenylyltransferase n=1 Tax=Paenibacillus alginolyticus TaxID=59839 RepID=UPI0003F6DF48|nr:ThiF family adenylyltransferase [Paenibacillus alginolyticus]MCY9664881.1 ThiF family adenylyltransferase [Paenibacillus alginolyticus]